MTRQKIYIGFLAAVLCGVMSNANVAHTQEDEIIAGGQLKYKRYCAYCHGVEGKGDGDMSAILVIPPADLTQLSKKNKGDFPFWYVYEMIDGRKEVRGHGNRTMPVWGFIFQAEEDRSASPQQVDVVRGRIWQLVYYLESIQQK